MMKKHFKPLQEGDIVDLVAPGFAPSKEEVAGAKQWLIDHGFRPRLPKQTLTRHFLHSSPDELRWELLKSALLAKDSQMIWCLRGGYGSNRLWPELLKLKKPAIPKLIIGLSDITSLHHFVNQKWGWPSLHTSHLDRLGMGRSPDSNVKEILQVLQGRTSEVIFKNLKAMNVEALQVKNIKSSLVGGNLVTLQSSLGTKTQIQLKDKILFLEEIGERAYRIDRVLVHLMQSGALKGCAGVVFGEFYKCNEPDGSPLYKKVLDRFAKEVRIPVFEGILSGHGEWQRPLFFGTKARLISAKGRGTLIVQSAVKEMKK